MVDARKVGECTVRLGAGREKKGDTIDYAVGALVHVKTGDHVEMGQLLFTVHANDPARAAQACQELAEAVEWSDKKVDRLPLFYGVIPEE